METIRSQNGVKYSRAELVGLIRRWGGFTTDAILEPETHIFTDPAVEGFIGYRNGEGCLIVFGDPVCSQEDRTSLSLAFHRHAEEQKKSVVYLGASSQFTSWAIKEICGSMIEFGKELVFNPPCDPRKKTGIYASLVRRKTKQAEREAVTVHEYMRDDALLEQTLDLLAKSWAKARRGPQIHISNAYLFEDAEGKRWFYAKQKDAIIGVIVLSKLQEKQGWLMNHLMVAKNAPHGTSELLVSITLEILEKEKCPFVTVGLVTAATLGEIVGLNNFSCWLARLIFKIVRNLGGLDGLNTFWGKFDPQSQPAYLLFSKKQIGLKELMGLKRALTQAKRIDG